MSAKKLRVKYDSSNWDPTCQLEYSSLPDSGQESSLNLIAIQKAMGNPLIVNKILECSSYPEWKSCRIVNQMWKNLTSKLMLKKDCCVVKIKYDVTRKLYRRSSYCQLDYSITTHQNEHSPQLEDHDLLSLNKILQTSINFPCSDFTFEVGDLGDKDVQTFFTIFGPSIRSLDLRFCLYAEGNLSTSQQIFTNLLTVQVPNIERLSTRSFYYIHDIIHQLELLPTSLKIFSCLDKSITTQAILKSAPNLQIVKVPKTCDLQWVIRSGRGNLVRQLVCDNDCKSEDLIDFANLNPQLQSITIKTNSDYARDSPLYQRELVGAFVKLLESTKDTLENLNLGDLGSFHEIQLPQSFSKCKTLKIGLSRYFPQQCFPSGEINLQKTFPILTTLDCTDLGCDLDKNWIKYFPQSTNHEFVISSVKTLRIPDNCTEFWMTKFRHLYTNFKRLIVVGKDNFQDMLPKVFKLWSDLEQIEIHMRKFSTLDFSLTGIPSEIIKQHLNDDSIYSQNYIDSLRVCPSLVDVKGLTNLKIVLCCPSESAVLPISYGSQVFAFNLMPQLKVVFQFDHNWYSLRELKRICAAIPTNVNIRHKKSSWRSAEEDEGIVNRTSGVGYLS